jgi:hypothetical protein
LHYSLYTLSIPICFSKDPTSPAAVAIADAAKAAADADVVVLAVGLGAQMEGEGCDRFDMTLSPVQQALQQAVAKVAKGKLVSEISQLTPPPRSLAHSLAVGL